MGRHLAPLAALDGLPVLAGAPRALVEAEGLVQETPALLRLHCHSPPACAARWRGCCSPAVSAALSRSSTPQRSSNWQYVDLIELWISRPCHAAAANTARDQACTPCQPSQAWHCLSTLRLSLNVGCTLQPSVHHRLRPHTDRRGQDTQARTARVSGCSASLCAISLSSRARPHWLHSSMSPQEPAEFRLTCGRSCARTARQGCAQESRSAGHRHLEKPSSPSAVYSVHSLYLLQWRPFFTAGGHVAVSEDVTLYCEGTVYAKFFFGLPKLFNTYLTRNFCMCTYQSMEIAFRVAPRC